MLIGDYRTYTTIVLIITALIGILIFASLLTNKTPGIVVLLSIINMFFSGYMSASAYNVVQQATLSDGTLVYNKMNTAAFDPVFFSGLFQIIYWFSIIAFLIGVAFTLVVIYDAKTRKKVPKWKQRWNDQHPGWN